MGGGLFGLLSTTILQDTGDSLPRAGDRYTYTVNVFNIYQSLGRDGVQSFREEARRERAQEWEQAMWARRDAEAISVAEQEAHNSCQYKKAKASWYPFGGTPGWDFQAIAKKHKIPPVWV